jgi:hypothetical protein
VAPPDAAEQPPQYAAPLWPPYAARAPCAGPPQFAAPYGAPACAPPPPQFVAVPPQCLFDPRSQQWVWSYPVAGAPAFQIPAAQHRPHQGQPPCVVAVAPPDDADFVPEIEAE